MDDIEQRASAGDPEAQFQLALRLLGAEHGPPQFERGAALMVAAADKGVADAAATTAVLAALGVAMPRDWGVALERLQRAAEGGSTRARGELAVLAADTSTDWARLRQAIDPEAWKRPVAKRVLSASPRIVAVDGFLSSAVCDWVIGRGAGKVAPALVFDPRSGQGAAEHGRTNSAFELDLPNLDTVILSVRERIAAAIGVPVGALEPPQILHYAVGQSFARHVDFLDPAVPAYAADLTARGQRIATFLIYLNDDYDGAETEFPIVDLRHKARRGDALYFANIDPTGAPDRRTVHAGLAPTRGEKWLFSQWVRDRARV